ncbi:MAG: cyclase [Leptolyngbya sp. DLM2.Bin15]|nr:MAG: cyclase [Leptolyngbya sp. DLM2.Bin15]
MTAFLMSANDTPSSSATDSIKTALLNGEVLLETRSHSAWGGAVTAQIYLPLIRHEAWQCLTDYPRWVEFFPNLTQSSVISKTGLSKSIQLYQAARKEFLLLKVQVEIYLRVFEIVQADQQQVQFCMEQGSFSDFYATLKLQDFGSGTLLTYGVSATPSIPVPSLLVQQAIRLDLPNNLRTLRQVLCRS